MNTNINCTTLYVTGLVTKVVNISTHNNEKYINKYCLSQCVSKHGRIYIYMI